MIYYFIFCLAFILAHISKKHKNTLRLSFFILSGFVLVIFAAVRSETVGIDVMVYMKKLYLLAQEADNIFAYLKGIHKEPLYLISTFLATKIFGSLQAVFFFNALIIIGFTYTAIWNLKEDIQIDTAVAVFSFIFYGQSLNISRQAMAAAVILYAFSKLLKGNKNKALVWGIVSVGFHYSAIVCFGIYFIIEIGKRKLSPKLKICFLVILFFLQFFYDKIFIFVIRHISFLPRGYVSSGYLYREYNISSCNLAIYGLCVLLAILLMVRQKPMGDFWFYVTCLALCGVFVGAKARVVARIFFYFEYLIIVMLSRKDIFPVKRTYGNMIICNTFLCFVISVHFYIMQIYLNVSGIFPYESIFFE